jgi:glycosyltransferase involved in cell wall biosynthesis
VGRVDDLPGVIDAAGIVIVPLRVGGGTRLKVLEALSMAKPVVSTRIGAEGITARDGEHLLLADTPEELAEAIRRLLADPVLAATLGRNGRHLVQASYDWELIGRAAADNLSAVIEAAARA